MAYQGLDTGKSFVLLAELDEATALTRVGLRTLRELRFVSEESAAVLTLLSIGSEKMLKATLGLAALDERNPWPSKGQMRDWGHNLRSLNEAACDRYQAQVRRSTAPGFISQLLDQCHGDETLHLLLDMLTDWGLRARFHRLDDLAGAPQPGPSPQTMWEELESRVLDTEPTLIARLAEVDGYDPARRRVNAIISESFRLWWQLHTRAWMTGIIGKDAKGLATILNRVLDEPALDPPS